MNDGDLRIVVDLKQDRADPIIFPLDLTTNTDEAKLIATSMAHLARELSCRGYLRDSEQNVPVVNIEIFTTRAWHIWKIAE